MFRIKTDIRQYKCETKEKVEKLIRNWVIRPNDLIYDQDENSWEPIGEHPSFNTVFDLLAESEANTPATVISKAPTDPNASNDDPEDVEEEEITNVSKRPKNGLDETSEGEDSRATDVFDHEEIVRGLAEKDQNASESNGALEMPVAPEGVEPVHHDEVTMMTDKTFDMFAEEAAESEVEDDEEESEPSEPKVFVSDELSEPSESSETSENSETSEPSEELGSSESEPTLITADSVDAPKLGRHDLPEDFFATNEIGVVDRAEVEKRDDLASQVSETSEVDEEWESMVDDFRTTEEINPEEVKTSLEERDESESDSESEPESETDSDSLEETSSEVALRDTDELERAPGEESDSEPTQLSDEELDEIDELAGDSEGEEEEVEEQKYINGYLIPAPFNIGPTPDDVKRGLRRTRVSAGRRIATFPEPKQKEYFKAELRNFDRSPPIPKDYTLLLIFACIVFLGFAILLLAQC